MLSREFLYVEEVLRESREARLERRATLLRAARAAEAHAPSKRSAVRRKRPGIAALFTRRVQGPA
jgi:hypothetical protein